MRAHVVHAPGAQPARLGDLRHGDHRPVEHTLGPGRTVRVGRDLHDEEQLGRGHGRSP